MFTHVWRGRIHPTTKDLAKACQRMMSSVYFKLRKLKPCLIGNVQLKVDIDEENDCFLRLYGKYTYFLINKKILQSTLDYLINIHPIINVL